MKEKWLRICNRLGVSARMKNIAQISAGTMFGQCISIVTLPIFTRLYGASIIGQWSLIASYATIINAFSDLGLSNAVMVEKNENKVHEVYRVTSTITLMLDFAAGIVILIYCLMGRHSGSLNPLEFTALVIIYAFMIQQMQICYSWLNRIGRYDVLMKNPVINNIAAGIISVLLWFLGCKTYGYCAGLLMGQFVTYFHMRRYLPKRCFTHSKESFRYTLGEHKDFVVFQMPTNIISCVKGQLPTILIGSFFGEEILGYYSISLRIMNIPINLLANSIGKVFFKTSTDMVRKGENIGEFTLVNLQKAIRICMIPLIGLLGFGDIIIEIVFGIDYKIAGTILRIVTIQNFFYFLMNASQGLSMTLKKQKYAMVSGIMQSICYILSMGVGYYVFGDYYVGIAMMSISFVIIQIVYFCCMFQVMEIDFRRYLKSVSKSLLIIGVCTLIIRVILLLLKVRGGI